MKKFLALAVCVVAIGCGDDSTTDTPPDNNARATTIAALTGVAADGQIIYDQVCSVCHGPSGAGTAAGNSLVDSSKTKAEVIESLLNGITGTTMVSYSSRTDQEIADLTAYTLAFQP